MGVPYPVDYKEISNSNARAYGGLDETASHEDVAAEEIPWHDQAFSIRLRLPALSAIVLRPAPPEIPAP